MGKPGAVVLRERKRDVMRKPGGMDSWIFSLCMYVDDRMRISGIERTCWVWVKEKGKRCGRIRVRESETV